MAIKSISGSIIPDCSGVNDGTWDGFEFIEDKENYGDFSCNVRMFSITPQNALFRQQYGFHIEVYTTACGKPQYIAVHEDEKRNFITKLVDNGDHPEILFMEPEPETDNHELLEDIKFWVIDAIKSSGLQREHLVGVNLLPVHKSTKIDVQSPIHLKFGSSPKAISPIEDPEAKQAYEDVSGCIQKVIESRMQNGKDVSQLLNWKATLAKIANGETKEYEACTTQP